MVNNESGESREYKIFKEEARPERESIYEWLCNLFEKIIKISPKVEERKELEDAINTTYLRITPTGTVTFSIFCVLVFIVTAIAYFLTAYLVFDVTKLFVPFSLIIIGLLILKPVKRIPIYLANRWRLQASNQMVLCVLYMVMYMRHTPNLELALKFATEHIKGPLAYDLKKVFWDVETGRYSTIKESIDKYLERWKETNLEFVEAFHLFEGSLYEPIEERRIIMLEKALEITLEGTYDKMMEYTHWLSGPMTMLYMLGIVLPILGLVIFPLAGSLTGIVKWWHIAILYNLILPVGVLIIGNNILSKRPTGYGEGEISLEFEKKGAGYLFLIIGMLIVLIGLVPLFVYYAQYDFSIGTFGNFFDYKDSAGPYGVGALLMSFLIPLGLALGLGYYYKVGSSTLIKRRNETRKLEKEFVGSLFQLGNRVGEGIPVEVAFHKVASSLSGTPSGQFFNAVSVNLSKFGMSLKEALFNKKTGAIVLFPSALVESSMKILVESAKKGSLIVAKSLNSVSDYSSRIHKINERLRDLLAEILTSINSQINFLTPIIAGIVVGVATMIVTIIGKLAEQFEKFSAAGQEAPVNLANIVNVFNIKDAIPPFYFQLVVGLYVFEVIFILTVLSNGIEFGRDKLNEKYLLGRNLLRGVVLYSIIGVAVTLIFVFLASSILSATYTS